MTAPATTAPPAAPPARFGWLLLAEWQRLTARRFVRLLLALALLAYLVILGIATTQFARTTPELLEQARARRDQAVQEQESFRQDCLRGAPPGQEQAACGPQTTVEQLPLDQFLPKQPFSLGNDLPGGSLAVAMASAALLFLVGATAAGADWSSKAIVGLLFWEPRRLRVLGAKLLSSLALAAVVAVVAQVVWLLAGTALARTRGTTDVPGGFWPDLLAQDVRAVVLALMTSTLGFGLAFLARSTGAALGLGFLYFAVIENAVRGVRPGWSQYLFGENAGALVQQGGARVFLPTQGPVVEETFVQLSNTRGALTLLLYCALVLLVGTALFHRRDIT
jgi:ABC-2 family transporter protein